MIITTTMKGGEMTNEDIHRAIDVLGEASASSGLNMRTLLRAAAVCVDDEIHEQYFEDGGRNVQLTLNESIARFRADVMVWLCSKVQEEVAALEKAEMAVVEGWDDQGEA